MTGLQKAYLKFLVILLLMASCQKLATDFTDAFGIALFGGPCESNVCRRGTTITAEETSFFTSRFPFLKGHVTEFHAAEDYGFQDHGSDYRFQISPEKLSELVKAKGLESGKCEKWENSTDEKSWWKPGSIVNKRCYSGGDPKKGEMRYELVYDVDNKIAYLQGFDY